MFKKSVFVALLAVSTTACIGLDNLSLDGVSIGGVASDGGSGSKKTNFYCDNGYKVLVSYQNPNSEIRLAFNNGKDTFIVSAYNQQPATHEPLYINDTQTVRWQDKNGVGTLTYPDNNYRDTKLIHQTTCRTR
ncbi:MAG: MliC family protein [Moraxella sp.]|nr:MliC family protein [Moraxella sp.]